MKLLRIILAGIVGGIIVFAWGAISHMALPVGEMGINNLPGEATLMPAMKDSITQPGFYMFPGMPKNPTEADTNAWMEKYKSGPAGVLIYRPVGGEVMSPKQLGTEFASNLAAALIAAFILSCVGRGVGRSTAIGFGLGVFAWLSIDVSYWNWYGFPFEMIMGSLIDQGIGWMAAGVAMGLGLGKRPVPAA